MRIRTIERSHTKAGPGRYHGQCKLIADIEGNVLGARSPTRRLPAARQGGNWKGVEYLSYAEHDRLKRMVRNELDEHGDPWTYKGARRKLIGDRAA